jgi:hypothetical protein
MKPLSLVKSDVAVGTVIFAVTLLLAFAVNVCTLVQFFCIVNVALFTVGIVGLFNICATPLVAFQSEFT